MKPLNKQPDHQFHCSVVVNNTRDKVWDFLIDVDRWKEWDTELVNSRLFSEFAVGSEGELKPKKGPTLKFNISEIEPHLSYTFITKMPVGTLEIKRIIKEKREGVEFTDDIRFTGFLKRIFGLMLGKGFKKVLPEVMDNFKRIVEKE